MNLDGAAKAGISIKLGALNIQGADARKQHVIDIHGKKQSSASPSDSSACLRCGGELVNRNGKNGAFIGCRNYPKCRYTN